MYIYIHICIYTYIYIYVHIRHPFITIFPRNIDYTLQHTASHCSTLQHTATQCNTLQHTATHIAYTLTPLPPFKHEHT